MNKIYIIEDDFRLSNMTKEYLEDQGYLVYQTKSFIDIMKEIHEIKPNLIILDINLPYFDGYYICREIRMNSNIPIIITSARSGDKDQILAVDLGADDYITKPFKLDILNSKIKAILRRSYGEYAEEKTTANINGVILDSHNYQIIYKEKSFELSKNELKLLKKFFDNPGEILSRATLFEELWDEGNFIDENTLTVNITRIRNVLKELGLLEVIKTKRGVGYMLDVAAIS